MSTRDVQKDAPTIRNLFNPPTREVGLAIDNSASAPKRRQRAEYRSRDYSAPVPVEATVHWFRSDERRGQSCSNQFGVMPTTPVRFRCLGTLTPRHPKRYRIELAQVLDWLPELNRRELKELGASLVEAIGTKLGVDVAPFNCDVMDLQIRDA